VVAVAAATSALLLRELGDPRPWLRFLWRAGAEPYAVALAWATVAPVPLALAALARRRPWWWVGVVTLHLAAVVAVTVRLRHLVPVPLAVAVVALALLGAWTCVTALEPAQRSARRASTARPASSRAIGTRNGEHDT
jgi:hypothetical protein